MVSIDGQESSTSPNPRDSKGSGKQMKPSASFDRSSTGGPSRASRPRLRAVACLVLAGCEACGSGGTGAIPSATAPEPPPGGSAASLDEPVPNLRLRVEPTLEGALQLVIEVHGDAPVTLARRVEVQREREGDYVPLESAPMFLRFNCGETSDECLRLIPGAAFHPPPWSPEAGQCGGQEAATAVSEPLRFVVRTCSGLHSVESVSVDPMAMSDG